MTELKPGDYVYRVRSGFGDPCVETAQVSRVTPTFVFLHGEHGQRGTGLAFDCRTRFSHSVQFHRTKHEAVLEYRRACEQRLNGCRLEYAQALDLLAATVDT